MCWEYVPAETGTLDVYHWTWLVAPACSHCKEWLVDYGRPITGPSYQAAVETLKAQMFDGCCVAAGPGPED